MVTRAQLAGGIADYLQSDIAGSIPETGLKIAIYAIGQQVRTNPDYILNSAVGRMFLAPDADGRYDIGTVADTLKDSMLKFGGLTLTLPAIPLASKGEKTLTFCVQDVDKLRARIEALED